MLKPPPALPSILVVQEWLLKNELQWDSGIEIKLSKDGVEYLEHLKIFESQYWDTFLSMIVTQKFRSV